MVMNKEDIYKKLEILKTDEGKFSYLKELSKKVDENPSLLSPETIKAFYETLGDLALKIGEINYVYSAYTRACKEISKEVWIKIGDKLFEERKNIFNILFAYRNAGEEGLIKLGDKYTEIGLIDLAIEFYQEGGLNKKEGYLRIGNKRLEEGDLVAAINAYEKAGIEISNEDLIRAGDECVKEGWLDLAFYFYGEAGYKGFIKLRDEFIEKRNLDDVIKAYEMAGYGLETIEEMEKLAYVYEKVGKGRKAMELRREIERKKKNK